MTSEPYLKIRQTEDALPPDSFEAMTPKLPDFSRRLFEQIYPENEPYRMPDTQTLFVVGVTPADEASNYNCEVTNLVDGCMATSNNAEILVDEDFPVILSQPQNVTATEGDAVFFTVGVDNPLFFKDNTRMLFGDAKTTISALVSEFKQ